MATVARSGHDNYWGDYLKGFMADPAMQQQHPNPSQRRAAALAAWIKRRQGRVEVLVDDRISQAAYHRFVGGREHEVA